MGYKNKKGYKRKSSNWFDKKRSFSIAGLAAKVYKLQSLINSEKKYSDTSINATQNTSGSVVLINGVAQGDTLQQRNGNSILMSNITIRGTVYMDASVEDTELTWWVIQDTQQVSDTAPSFTTIFDTSMGSTTGFLNRSGAPGRFKILLKRRCRQQGETNLFNMDANIKLPHPGLHIKFNGTAYTDIAKNGIYIVAASTRTASLPTTNVQVRVNYYDN